MGKILAIDFGLKRCGLAITDDTNTFAFGLATIDSKTLADYINSIKNSENIDCIVLGYPRRLDLSDSHVTENVRQLKVFLEKQHTDLLIELYDERYTSSLAQQSMHMAGATRKQKGQKELVDKLSATILLQSYLSSKQH